MKRTVIAIIVVTIIVISIRTVIESMPNALTSLSAYVANALRTVLGEQGCQNFFVILSRANRDCRDSFSKLHFILKCSRNSLKVFAGWSSD